ncbi:MAG: hypothetical protein IJF13_05525 [Clostridia bacterium]|nr:hypothetical protein [Clostridia bacterium]
MTQINDFEFGSAVKIAAGRCLADEVTDFLSLNVDDISVDARVEKNVMRKLKDDRWEKLRSTAVKTVKYASIVLISSVCILIAISLFSKPIRAAVYDVLTGWYEKIVGMWKPISEEVSLEGNYGGGVRFIETKNTFVFCDTRDVAGMAYIDKKTGEVFPSCNIPGCTHPDESSGPLCGAICDHFTVYTLCYSPVTGRVYYFRKENIFGPKEKQGNVLYSFDIDNMDLTVREHYRLPLDIRVESMKYSDGKLYFGYDHTDENGNLGFKIDSYDTMTHTVENVIRFDHDGIEFTVIGDDLYYEDHKNVLSRYRISAGETEVLIDGGSPKEYVITENKIYMRDSTSIVSLDIESGEEELIVSHPHSDGRRLAVTDDGRVYYSISSVDIYNCKGGKLYACGNCDLTELYDFGENSYINTIVAYGDNVFMDVEIDGKQNYARITIDGDKIICYLFPEP